MHWVKTPRRSPFRSLRLPRKRALPRGQPRRSLRLAWQASQFELRLWEVQYGSPRWRFGLFLRMGKSADAVDFPLPNRPLPDIIANSVVGKGQARACRVVWPRRLVTESGSSAARAWQKHESHEDSWITYESSHQAAAASCGTGPTAGKRGVATPVADGPGQPVADGLTSSVRGKATRFDRSHETGPRIGTLGGSAILGERAIKQPKTKSLRQLGGRN